MLGFKSRFTNSPQTQHPAKCKSFQDATCQRVIHFLTKFEIGVVNDVRVISQRLNEQLPFKGRHIKI